MQIRSSIAKKYSTRNLSAITFSQGFHQLKKGKYITGFLFDGTTTICNNFFLDIYEISSIYKEIL